MKNEKKKNSNPHTHWSEPLILTCNTKFIFNQKKTKDNSSQDKTDVFSH